MENNIEASMSSDSEYVFHKDAVTLSEELITRSKRLSAFFNSSQLFNRARRMYNLYYNRAFTGTDGSFIGAAGENREYNTLSVNHFRNLLIHTLSLLTQSKLSFDAQALSTDLNARNSAIVANQLLEQLFYEQKISVQTFRAVELGLLMGTSFLTVEWEQAGKIIGQDGEGTPVFAGKPRVKSHSIFDVILEPFKDDFADQNWVVVRETESRWNLIGLYPEYADEIKRLPQITDIQRYEPFFTPEQDHVFVFKAYHRETPAIPSGRYTVFCQDGLVLRDGPNPYVSPLLASPNGGIPVFCFRPGIQYGSAYGYSISFDLAPIQEALSVLDSSIITNQSNFATQNIAVPRGSSCNTTDIVGGNKLIEYDHIPELPGGGKPEVLQLCATPAEVFSYREKLVQNSELVSGINAVLRGQPQANLISGTALALVATQANTFNTTLESNYTTLIEDTAQFLLYVISRFQKTEDLVALIGKGKSNEIRSFKGDDLAAIRKVRVVVGNPLARTTAGKINLAEMLLQNQIITTPEAVIEALETGNISKETEDANAEYSFIKYENEAILRGEEVHVMGTDTHPKHILAHRKLSFNPEIRRDPVRLQILNDHIIAHLDQFDLMASGNPTLLNMIMGTPMPMPTPNPDTGVPGQPVMSAGPTAQEGGVAEAAAPGKKPGGNQDLAAAEDPQALAMQSLNKAAQRIQESK